MEVQQFYQRKKCTQKDDMERKNISRLKQWKLRSDAISLMCEGLVEHQPIETILVQLEHTLCYQKEWFAYDWLADDMKARDLCGFRRFLQWISFDWEVLKANITVSYPSNLVSDGMLEQRVSLIAKKEGAYHGLIIVFKKSEFSLGGKQLHTNLNTRLEMLLPKAILEKVYPGIIMEYITILNGEDGYEIPETFLETTTKKSNRLTVAFGEYYDENGCFNFYQLEQKVKEVIKAPIPGSCYGCEFHALCKTEPLVGEKKVSVIHSPYSLPLFTETQKQVVNFKEGSLLVVAGPGSGKTATLIGRVHELIKSGVHPERIMTVTFTNKAVNELKERCLSFLPEEDLPYISTLHALAFDILKANRHLFPRGIRICSDTSKLKLLKKLTDHADKLHGQNYTRIYGKKGFLNDLELQIREVNSIGEEAFLEKYPETDSDFFRLAETFTQIMKDRGYLVLDDSVKLCVLLLKKHPEILEMYQNGWDYIMVDEYQDVDRYQSEMIDLLANKKKNLVCFGDPDQEIYGFRGGTNAFMLSFTDRFPAYQLTLDKNFRSTKEIVALSNAFIKLNKNRIDTSMVEVKGEKQKPEFTTVSNTRELETLIKKCLEKGYSFKDVAIISRKNNLLEQLSREMRLPVIMEKSLLIYSSAFRLLLCVLSFFFNGYHEDDTWLSLFHLFRITPETDTHYDTWIMKRYQPFTNTSFYEQMEVKDNIDSMMGTMFLLYHSLQCSDLNGFLKYYQRKLAVLEGMNDLVDMIKSEEIASLSELYSHLLFMDEICDERRILPREKEAITLITAHESKGKEYPVVFVYGLDNDFPLSQNDAEDVVEESRRLLYVAMTRAKDILYGVKLFGNSSLIDEISCP